MTTSPDARTARWVATTWLGVTLFLLTADHLALAIGGVKLKPGYAFVAGMWLFAPRAMLVVARAAVADVPRWPLLVLLPIGVSIALSHDLRSSLLWLGWAGFDLATVITVYAFARTQRLEQIDVRRAATLAIAMIAAAGLAQFAAIFVLGRPILDPQVHLGVYRLNGVAGWPHFLAIDAFLLLPLVLTGPLSRVEVAVLAVMLFVLAMSTAKIAWLLAAALVGLLLVLRRARPLLAVVGVAVPLAVAALLVPLPSRDGATLSGLDRLGRYAAGALESTSIQDRVMIGTMGLQVVELYPWFGVGPRAYATYVWTRFDVELPGRNKLDIEGKVAAKHENIWIEFMAELGIPATLGLLAILVRSLWIRHGRFVNALHAGTWCALVLYFAVSGTLSQTGLLTLVYAVFGLYWYARTMAIPSAADRTAPASPPP